MAISVETFFLDPDAQGTLQAQIQQMIAQGILSGRFRKGEKLPSSRKLASHLGVSRICRRHRVVHRLRRRHGPHRHPGNETRGL